VTGVLPGTKVVPSSLLVHVSVRPLHLGRTLVKSPALPRPEKAVGSLHPALPLAIHRGTSALNLHPLTAE
jgi:hypothetical protein